MRLEAIRRRLQHGREDSGFSIIEMVVTIMVLSIVMTVIFGTVLNLLNASNTFKERTQQQADTRFTIDTLVRDLRQAYYGQAGTPSVSPASTARSITFYSPDRGVPYFRLRLITYTLLAGSTTLTRQVTTSTNDSLAVVGTATPWAFPGSLGPIVPVLRGVTNTSVFTYKNQADATPTALDPLQAVQIDLVVVQSPATSPTPQTYHTQVNLRVTDQ
jgi:prepilin-type N-terminal cleavage/methylation domain-containing protein